MSDLPVRPAKRPFIKKLTLKGLKADPTAQPARRSAIARNVATAVADQESPKHFRSYRLFLKRAELPERVKIEREGVPYQVVEELIDEVGISTAAFQGIVRIPAATYKKRIREKGLFSGTAGQSVVGWMDLINKVEDMLAAEQDNEEARNFDVAAWVGDWIQRPQKALGGMAPAEFMDTPSGRESVMRVLGAIQSGAYQ